MLSTLLGYTSKTENNEHKAVQKLHEFTHEFCIDTTKEELTFRCNECPFENHDDGTCAVKKFKCKFDPDFKDFGSMGDL